MIDKTYCASSFLMYRYVINEEMSFNEKSILKSGIPKEKKLINDSVELEEHLREKIAKLFKTSKPAIALSGGVDSAVLAKMVPAGTVAYTFRCVIPGEQLIDESIQAAKYVKECGLVHKIIDVTWDDMIKYSPDLMKHKNQPIHSIEVQIYKAALQAKTDGFDTLIFGETADCSFGGLDKLLSKDWKFGDFVDRYSYVLPYKVLKDYKMDLEPIQEFTDENGYVNVHEFLRNKTVHGDHMEYNNPCSLAGINYVGAYEDTWLNKELDLARIRGGEPKYFVGEIFKRLYGDMEVPDKIPMPRPTELWLKNWGGVERKEFYPNSDKGLSGDQRWMLFVLEWYLNLLDGGKIL